LHQGSTALTGLWSQQVVILLSNLKMSIMKFIRNLKNLKNKKVLVRVDFNVPVGSDGVIDEKEDWRIKAALPTIKYLLENKAKVILMTHLGRPKGKVVESLKLGPVQDKLTELLDLSITKTPDCIGKTTENIINGMRSEEIVLLENLRFHKEEEENDEKFAKELASLADIYVNDAFSDCHRAHASISVITKFLPSYAGLLLEKEVKVLSEAVKNPERPASIVIGGAKAETKVPVIEYLLDKFDHILVGGVVANVILKAKGIDTGKSLMDGINIKEVDRKINLESPKLHIPVDVVACNSENKEIALSAVGRIGDNMILDIGTESVNLYSRVISDSKTVIWNGPMGMFENKDFFFGTREIAKAIMESKAKKIVGGGDTITALSQLGLLDKADYVCTGGGAMLEFLSGKKLPGLEALK